MRENDELGVVMKCVLALESRVNALYEFISKKNAEKPDGDQCSVTRKQDDKKTADRATEEDDVFGHRSWITEHNRVAMDTQMFEENK